MSLSTDIQKLVEMEQIKGQLNPEVLQRVLDLQRTASDLEAKREQAAKELAAATVSNKKLADELAIASAKIDEIARRENECAKREAHITTLELTAKHEAQRVQDHRSMFELVFRNIETRRNVFTAVPGLPASEGTYQSTVYPAVAENTQRESAQ